MKLVSSCIVAASAVMAFLGLGCTSAKEQAETRSEPRKIVGYMLDVSRFRVPTMETVKRQVDILADLGYNHFQLYTEHTFAYPGHEHLVQSAGRTDVMIANIDNAVENAEKNGAMGALLTDWEQYPRLESSAM